jgi:hypothetical protein
MGYLPVNDHTKVGGGVEEKHATAPETKPPLPQNGLVPDGALEEHHVL